MRLAGRTLFALSFCWASLVIASHDVRIDLELEGGSEIERGVLTPLTITITNIGMDVAERVKADTSYLATRGFRTARIFTIDQTPPCRLAFTDFVPPPPRPATLAVTIFPDTESENLASGESVSCVVGFEVAEEAPSVFEFGIRARSNNVDDDASPQNNRQDLLIEVAVVPVPAFSILAGAMLIALMALVAATPSGKNSPRV